MVMTRIITAQIPVAGNNSGAVKAFVNIEIFLMSIASAYPALIDPINVRVTLNHLGKTSTNKIPVIKQIIEINTPITKCIKKPPLDTVLKIT